MVGVRRRRLRDRRSMCGALMAVLCVAGVPPTSHAAAMQSSPRIVSLSPHITELLFAAGAGSRVIGVDDASDYPPAARNLPRLGEASMLDVEALLRLSPTLVILWGTGTPPRVRAELERLKLPVIATEQTHLDDVAAAIEDFGRLADTAAVAAAAAGQYRSELSGLRSRYADRPRLRVFYQVWDRPLYTLSGGHVVSEAMSLCGGDNIFAGLATLAPSVDREAVVERNPDVILIGATGPAGARQVTDWSRFSGIEAVSRKHVFLVDPSLVGRMSPRILDGVREVCAAFDRARASGVRLHSKTVAR